MGFVGPKLAWLLLEPLRLLALVALLGLVLLATRWRRLGRWLCAAVAAALVLLSVLPVGGWLLQPLEDRFPAPAAPPPAETLGGIVLLGGAVQPRLYARRGQPALNDAAERMTAFVALARRYPDLPLLFTGGDARLFGGEATEAAVARQLFADLGLPPERVRFEDRARNTWENAVFSADLVRPSPDRPWLLVTSAAHMPRAVGSFRRAGWSVVAWPVDYRTDGTPPWPKFDPLSHAQALSHAAHAWTGLLFYWLAGRTDALLPGPLPGR